MAISSRRSCLPLLVVALFMVTPMVLAQSLGDVARKERKRRQKNRAEGVLVHEYAPAEGTEASGDGDRDDVDPGDANANTDTDSATDDLGGQPNRTSRPHIPSRVDVSVDSESHGEESSSIGGSGGTSSIDRIDQERRERQRQEVEWRARTQRARNRIEQARARKRMTDDWNLNDRERYEDEQGNPIAFQDLLRIKREAEAELAAAEKAFEELREEARRQNVPPGWLR